LSSWCKLHSQREARNGAAEQLAIRYPALKPFKLIARRWLDSNSGHPALKLVYADLDRMLYESTLVQITRRPKRSDHLAIQRLELQRLARGGVTGAEVFHLTLSLHLYSLARPHSLQPFSRPFWFNLSRLVMRLRMKTTKTEKKGPQDGSRMPPAVLEGLGRDLTTRCAIVLDAIVKAMHRAADEAVKRSATIAEAVRATAFEPPSTSTTTTTTNPTNMKDSTHV
jgi:hypothetical protein